MKSLVESVTLHKRQKKNTLIINQNPPQYENIILKLCNLLVSLNAIISSFSFFFGFWNEILFNTSELLKDSCSVSSYSDTIFPLAFDFFLLRDNSEYFLLSSKVKAVLKKGKFIASSGLP